MKKLAILFLITACTSANGPHYDDGHDRAYWDIHYYDKCQYFLTDNTPLKNQGLVKALRENKCIYMTNHFDYSTNPLHQDVEYFQGYNYYVREYVLGNR